MTSQQLTRKPTTPGEVLQHEYLGPLNLKIADVAIRLSRVFDTSIEFRLNLQQDIA